MDTRCASRWGGDIVKKIAFYKGDTASDSYQQKLPGNLYNNYRESDRQESFKSFITTITSYCPPFPPTKCKRFYRIVYNFTLTKIFSALDADSNNICIIIQTFINYNVKLFIEDALCNWGNEPFELNSTVVAMPQPQKLLCFSS
eukprot:sb/3473994/